MAANTTVKIREGQVLRGPYFPEPIHVEKVRPLGAESWIVGFVDAQSERFRKVILTAADIEALTIEVGEEEA